MQFVRRRFGLQLLRGFELPQVSRWSLLEALQEGLPRLQRLQQLLELQWRRLLVELQLLLFVLGLPWLPQEVRPWLVQEEVPRLLELLPCGLQCLRFRVQRFVVLGEQRGSGSSSGGSSEAGQGSGGRDGPGSRSGSGPRSGSRPRPGSRGGRSPEHERRGEHLSASDPDGQLHRLQRAGRDVPGQVNQSAVRRESVNSIGPGSP